MSCMTKRAMDIVDMQSYEAGYASGCLDGTEAGYEVGYYDGKRDFRQLVKRKQEDFLYFIRQKVFGIFMLLATAMIVHLCEGDATIALCTIPTGLMLICTRKRFV